MGREEGDHLEMHEVLEKDQPRKIQKRHNAGTFCKIGRD
jgi:hypothetical protein